MEFVDYVMQVNTARYYNEPALIGSLLASAAMNEHVSQEQYAYLLRVARQ